MVIWPTGTITRVVKGTYLHSDLSPRSGKVVFTPTAVAVRDDTGATIITRTPITVLLDVNGQFSEAMATTDNFLLAPNTWAYDVAVRINGLKPAFARVYIPFGDGSPVDLSTHILYSTTTIENIPLAPVALEAPVYPPVITPRGPVGPQGSTGLPGITPIFSRQSIISVATGYTRFYFENDRIITAVRVAMGTAPSGSSVVINVLVNGVNACTATVVENTYTSLTAVGRAVSAGDYATISIVSVGSTFPGAEMTVALIMG